jgi:TetR/AcrR family acrAB operon transcriptional repressor
MARRTRAEAEATRVGILDAAELCFLRDGVSRTTLEQIAAQAGYTRGAVYWHFANKLEVLEAVLDRVTLPVFAQLEAMGRDVERPVAALRRFFDDAFDAFEHDRHARNVFTILRLRCEQVRETRPIYDRQQRLKTSSNNQVTAMLQRARQLGQLRADVDPVRCARAIQYLVDGALHDWIQRPGAMSLRRDAMPALDVLLEGIVARRTPAPSAGSKGARIAARRRDRTRP